MAELFVAVEEGEDALVLSPGQGGEVRAQGGEGAAVQRVQRAFVGGAADAEGAAAEGVAGGAVPGAGVCDSVEEAEGEAALGGDVLDGHVAGAEEHAQVVPQGEQGGAGEALRGGGGGGVRGRRFEGARGRHGRGGARQTPPPCRRCGAGGRSRWSG